MLTIRKGNDRGVTRVAWLDSRHTFSFGDYYDPAHHNFRIGNRDYFPACPASF